MPNRYEPPLTAAELIAFEREVADRFNAAEIRAHGVVYVGINLRNGKRYVGQTTSKEPQRRIRSHFKDAENGRSSLIAQAIRKHGADAFEFEIIWACRDQGSLNATEDALIGLFETISPRGYNLRRGGSRGKHSPELSLKMKSKRGGASRSREPGHEAETPSCVPGGSKTTRSQSCHISKDEGSAG